MLTGNKNKNFTYFASDFGRIKRALVLAVADVIGVIIATFCSLWIRYDFKLLNIPDYFMDSMKIMLPVNIVSVLVIFVAFSLYKSVWRYASTDEMLKIIGALICNAAVQCLVVLLTPLRLPRSYYLFFAGFLGICVVATRYYYRIVRVFKGRIDGIIHEKSEINVMIIGAGSAGNSILKEFQSSSYISGKKVRCFIDDNAGVQGKVMGGIPIVGDRSKIMEAVEAFSINEIIIAIPSASRTQIKEIVEICKDTGCKLQMVPGIYQLINGDVSVSQLREVSIEDLLGRDPVEINVDEVIGYVSGKTILVTGGGGSIGSELCRQLAAHNPKKLIILDIYENNAYDIQQELLVDYPELDLDVLIASVRNTQRINQIFEEYKPDIVYHAAAHKHVPLMEDSPGEAIKNNVFGTYKTAMAASKSGVKKFVMISTDKAVNPTNIMGASKRICEMIIQMMNERSETDFVAVRFGNVLGSNGSVIPLFKKQIEQGGPVTVTDPEIIRYFMTIPEAVSLVLQAGAYAKGGEIFVLDMGQPVKILDLAKNLIQLSGYRVGEDIDIVFTGLRPGEKMYEELLMDEEGLKDTANSMIHVGAPIKFDYDLFEKQLVELDRVSKEEPDKVRELVANIIGTYKYEEK
ncbi:MAG: polysaccharide biosynthesis protein [Lachnospiraceae bacterium]|nr:polysaccharide biosynthesis protein [Lachnospiraceae bacterium]